MRAPGWLPTGRNVVPGEYRGVSVTDVDFDPTESGLTEFFLGREAYRRTRFIVVRAADSTALLAVRRDDDGPLFAPITEVAVLALPADCAYVHDPDVDTAIPSELARVAAARAPGVRAVAVQGRYEHVNVIVDPEPLRITVREVVPPYPAKLLDQTRRLLGVAENLPPIELVGELAELPDLAAGVDGDVLVPCRGSGFDVPGARTSYLDERPPRRDWTLVGCERSQQIHEWFYGERAPQVDICPRATLGTTEGAVLTKCCLLERHIEVEGGRAVVPWGASLDQISAALNALVAAWEPTWAPA